MKTAVIILIILLILFVAAGIIGGSVFVDMALNLERINKKGNKTLTKNTQSYEYPPYTPGVYCKDPKNWVLNESNYRNVFLKNDGLKLHAIFIPNTGHRYVVVCHGYSNKAIGMGPFLHKFYLEGFNVLAPDARGHGESEGKYTYMGYREKHDIVRWIHYIIKQDPEAEIVLWGISMGASTVMFTVGEDLPDNVKCAVEDCGYASLMDQYRYECNHTVHIPSFPLVNFVNLVTMCKLHFNIRKADTKYSLPKCRIPMLFIHGDNDTFVPFSNLKKNYDYCQSEKEMLVMEDATHARSSSFHPELYWNTVFQFCEKHLSNKEEEHV